MLFNSFDFALFLPIVFLLYWFVFNKHISIQNVFLVVVSYIFYGWWDWRFLMLIAFSSLIDYSVGIGLSKTNELSKRKLLLLTSILVNLAFLGFFKYYNFFADSFADAFSFFGMAFEAKRLNIILPVGISFYTFQTMSYSIDVYRKKMQPTQDIFAFFAFVSFFPQLVAGPIERASNLLPQFYKKRNFEYEKATDGLRQILWGLFKKIVIADNLAVYVNEVFLNHADYSGSTLFLGGFLFCIQLYGDFSGYSDIAIGSARLFGFNLKKNFDFPLFSRTPAELWRRWHISLTAWFREYLLKPLGGYRGGAWLRVRNTVIIFTLIGLWHGADWTFLIFGFVNALLILPEFFFRSWRIKSKVAAQGKYLPSIKEVLQIATTFTLFTFTVIFFRSSSLSQSLSYIAKIFSASFFTIPQGIIKTFGSYAILLLFVFMMLVEWIQREREHGLDFTNLAIPKYFSWSFYYGIIMLIILYGGTQQDFVYFQF